MRKHFPGHLSIAGVSVLLHMLFSSLVLAGQPKTIILMISDGCGFNHVKASGYYEYGESGAQIYEQFPVKYAMSTYSIKTKGYDAGKAWKRFKYVMRKPTDSAAAATAMACGIKTKIKYLGLTSKKQYAKNIVEYSEAAGKATGLITSVPFNHATPAGFAVHYKNRDDYRQIAEQMLNESAVDLLMGCGHPEYDKGGKSLAENKRDYKYLTPELWERVRKGRAGGDRDADGIEDPWILIEDRSSFAALKTAVKFKRILGIPKVFGTLQQGRPGDENALPYVIPLIEAVPFLEEMALGALHMLSFDPDGFFLMIEGGAVDWSSHDNQSGRMIEEMTDFNRTVRAVVNWIDKKNGWNEVLLIVTADHECGYLTGPGSGKRKLRKGEDPLIQWQPLINHGRGNLPGMEWHSDEHTNSLVPFYAKGAGAQFFCSLADEEDPVFGLYLDNAELGQALIQLISD